MKLLFLGGTSFVGRHMVAEALAAGHAVTLFNRGTHAEVYPGVEQIHGDRDGGLGALDGREWDAVIDTSGYFPRLVRASAERLAGRVGRYVFVSTISVYADAAAHLDEHGPLKGVEDPTVEAIRKDTYGGLKVLCEQAVAELYPDAALILRPGIIAGPFDPTDRFTHWAARMAEGGRVVAPAPGDRPVQVIDARDFAAFTLRLTERGETGVYNAVGPAEPTTRSEMLQAITPAGSDAEVVWVSVEALEAEGLETGAIDPFYTEPEDAGFFRVDAAKARAAGLTLRPLAETARDTLAWLASEPARPIMYTLDRAIEAKLAR